MTSLYQQLNPARTPLPNNIGNIKQMMNMLKGVKNPNQLITSMMQQNPQMKQVMNLVNNSNMSPKDLFYKMAKEQGVDPEEILKQLR